MNEEDTNAGGGGGISPPPPPTPLLTKLTDIINECLSLYSSGGYGNRGTNGIGRTNTFSPSWLRDIFDILSNNVKSQICYFGLQNGFCWKKLFVKEPFGMYDTTVQQALSQLVKMEIFEVSQEKDELEDIHRYFPSPAHVSMATIYVPIRSEKVELLRGITQDNWYLTLDEKNNILTWKNHRAIQKNSVKRKKLEKEYGDETLETEGLDYDTLIALDSIFKADVYKKAYLELYKECLRIHKFKLLGQKIVEIIKKLLGYRDSFQASKIFRDLDKEYGVFYHAEDGGFTIKPPHNVVEDYRRE